MPGTVSSAKHVSKFKSDDGDGGDGCAQHYNIWVDPNLHARMHKTVHRIFRHCGSACKSNPSRC
jgi:hypothetical protein